MKIIDNKNNPQRNNPFYKMMMEDVNAFVDRQNRQKELEKLYYFEVIFHNTTGSNQNIQIFDTTENTDPHSVEYQNALIDEDFGNGTDWNKSGGANIDSGKLKFEKNILYFDDNMDGSKWQTEDGDSSGAGSTVINSTTILAVISASATGSAYIEKALTHNMAGETLDLVFSFNNNNADSIAVFDGDSTDPLIIDKSSDDTGGVWVHGITVSNYVLQNNYITFVVQVTDFIGDATEEKAGISINSSTNGKVEIWNYEGNINRTDKSFSSGDEITVSVDIDDKNNTFLKLTIGGDIIDLTGESTGTYEIIKTLSNGGDLVKIENKGEISQLDNLSIERKETTTLISDSDDLDDYKLQLASKQVNPFQIHGIRFVAETMNQLANNVFTFKYKTPTGNIKQKSINLRSYITNENPQPIVDLIFDTPIIFAQQDLFEMNLINGEKFSLIFFYKNEDSLRDLKNPNNPKARLQQFYR
jgi:hypothetical protein